MSWCVYILLYSRVNKADADSRGIENKVYIQGTLFALHIQQLLPMCVYPYFWLYGCNALAATVNFVFYSVFFCWKEKTSNINTSSPTV